MKLRVVYDDGFFLSLSFSKNFPSYLNNSKAEHEKCEKKFNIGEHMLT